MAVLFVALAVVPAALVLWLLHSGARALFPTVPTWVSITGVVTVAGMAPVLYFVIGERTRLLLADVGVVAPRHEAFLFAISVMVIAALAVAVVVVPRRRCREADARAQLDQWFMYTAIDANLRVGRVQRHRQGRRRRAGWATVAIGDAVCEMWLDGPAQVGEFVLLRCHPNQPAAVVERLDRRVSAVAARHVDRIVHAFGPGSEDGHPGTW